MADGWATAAMVSDHMLEAAMAAMARTLVAIRVFICFFTPWVVVFVNENLSDIKYPYHRPLFSQIVYCYNLASK